MKIKKPLLLIAVFALIGLSFTFCAGEPAEDNENDKQTENPYLGNEIIINDQQVWKRNKDAKKISQAHLLR